MNEIAPTDSGKKIENDRKNRAKRRSLFHGEWLIIILIFFISGVAGFFYTRAELNKMENRQAETQKETPTPVEERI